MARAGMLRIEVSRSQLGSAAECLRSALPTAHGYLHSFGELWTGDLLKAEAERLNGLPREDYLELLEHLGSRLKKAARRATAGVPAIMMSTGQLNGFFGDFPWECERAHVLTLATLGANARGWIPSGMFGRPQFRGQEAGFFFSACLSALMRRRGRKHAVRKSGEWATTIVGERHRKRLKAQERARADYVAAVLKRLKLPN